MYHGVSFVLLRYYRRLNYILCLMKIDWNVSVTAGWVTHLQLLDFVSLWQECNAIASLVIHVNYYI